MKKHLYWSSFQYTIWWLIWLSLLSETQNVKQTLFVMNVFLFPHCVCCDLMFSVGHCTEYWSESLSMTSTFKAGRCSHMRGRWGDMTSGSASVHVCECVMNPCLNLNTYQNNFHLIHHGETLHFPEFLKCIIYCVVLSVKVDIVFLYLRLWVDRGSVIDQHLRHVHFVLLSC